jgi:hypothetical protein
MATFDGETAIQYFGTLLTGEDTLITPLLPNSGLDDCCSDFEISVLANDSGEDLQNDFTTFLAQVSATTSSASYSLYKCDELVATFTNNDYGTNYAFNFVTGYIGYKVDWSLVLLAFGIGKYRIKLSTTDAVLGNVDRFSETYNLRIYHPTLAEGTVRIEWVQNGTIGDLYSDKKQFLYRNLNWSNQIRLKGFFGYPEATYTKDNIKYQNGLREWVKDENEPKFKLKIKRISASIHDLLMIEVLMSDRCSVTNYNSKSEKDYLKKDIIFDTEYKPEWKPLISKLANVELTCIPRYNNYKKHRK